MANNVLSIELTSTEIKMCVLDFNNRTNSCTVEKLMFCETPMNAVINGEIKDVDEIVIAIQTMLAMNQVKIKECIFVINSLNIHSRVIQLPKQNKPKDYIDLIEAKHDSENLFPVELKGNLVTYSLLNKYTESIDSEDKKGNTKTKKVQMYNSIAYTAPTKMMDGYLEVAKMLGYSVKYIDYVGNSVYNIVTSNFKDGSFVLVHISDLMCLISIIDETGTLHAQRMLDFSTSAFVEPMLKKQSIFGINNTREAYDYINNKGFLDDSYQFPSLEELSELDIEDMEDARNEMLDNISQLFDGVVAFLNHFRGNGKDINHVIFVNQSYRINSFVESLSLSINRAVEEFNVNSCVKSTVDYDLNPFVGTIGAVINPANFNILNSIASSKDSIVKRVVFYTVFGSVLAGVGLVGFNIIKHQRLKMDNESLQIKIEAAERAREIYDGYQGSLSNLETVTDFDSNSSTGLNNLDLIISEIAKIMPTGRCKIDGFSGDNSSVSFSVTVDSKDTMAKFLQGLNDIEYFTSVDIDSVSDGESDEFASGRAVSSSLVCHFEEEETEQQIEYYDMESTEGGESGDFGAGYNQTTGSGYGQVTDIDTEYSYTGE